MASASGVRLTLADRVEATRHNRFVGRVAERVFFDDALNQPDPPFAVLFVHGPGGIGKTALLGEYRRIAGAAGYRVVAIDGRACEPSPPGVIAAIARELGMAEPERCLATLAAQNRLAVLIDTGELLQPLDGWLRHDLLPRLPASAVTVIAGRNPPDPRWRASPGWESLVAVQALRNLDYDDSRAYLAARGVPQAAHASVLAFTHGHPLALSLAGDVAARGDTVFAPEEAPDVIAALLERLVEREPSARHRQALEVSATARVTTETLLARAFGDEDAHRLFAWLCGLSFVQVGRDGVFPHDLAREVLVANLRWRHPARFVETHRLVHDHVIERVRATRGREQSAELYSLMFLHRNNPTWQSFAPVEQHGHVYIEAATPDDHGIVINTVHHHEGVRQAEIADRWLQLQPEGLSLMRDVHGEIAGFVLAVALQGRTRADLKFDPVAIAIFDMIDRHGPLRPGDEATCARFCMGRDAYRTPSLRLSFAMIGSAMIYTRPRLAWLVTPVVDPTYWRPLFEYVHINPYPDADVAVDGRTWHMYAHDWRQEPVEALDRILTEREMSLSPVLESVAAAPALTVLAEADFRQAVRQAMRDYHRADAIAGNPLSHCRLVTERRGEEAVMVLRDLLRDAVGELASAPRTKRLHDALHHTWLEPERTQEAVAELLDLPFSTYRRHLAAAVDLVSGELWRRELALGTLTRA